MFSLQSLERYGLDNLTTEQREEITQLSKGIHSASSMVDNLVTFAGFLSKQGELRLTTFDFGDMVESWRVVEPVIAATYAMLEQSAPLSRAADVIRGYHAETALTETEIALCLDFICMRLCTSVCINAHQVALAPEEAHALDRLLGHAAGALVVRSSADALRWIAWLRCKRH